MYLNHSQDLKQERKIVVVLVVIPALFTNVIPLTTIDENIITAAPPKTD